MDPRLAAGLVGRTVAVAAATSVAILAVHVAVGGGGMLGLLVVLVGGLVAGSTLVNARPTGPGGLEAAAAPLVSTLDPLAHADAEAPAPLRRFATGLGLLVAGGWAMVWLG